MDEPVVFVFENKQNLVTEFSSFFSKLVSQADASFRVALSGGGTPKIWFGDLAANHRDDFDWQKVHLYWGDERCVPPDHSDSNFGMTNSYLLEKIDIPESNVHRIKGELDPKQAAEEYSKELSEFQDESGIPEFDLVILGMGDDGHTASIFPFQIHLWNDPGICVVATHPDSGQKRVSLTGKVINNARAVAFLVTGEAKSEKVEAILNGSEKSTGLPAALVNPVRGELFWFLDKEAAGSLRIDE